jgi:flagellar hook-basal body complex protein FliE
MSPLEATGIPLALPQVGRETTLVTPAETTEPGFEALVEQAVMKTNAQLRTAEHHGAEFAAGRLDDIHGTMLELSKADIELRFVGNVRNKVIDAFYELWRMQL